MKPTRIAAALVFVGAAQPGRAPSRDPLPSWNEHLAYLRANSEGKNRGWIVVDMKQEWKVIYKGTNSSVATHQMVAVR